MIEGGPEDKSRLADTLQMWAQGMGRAFTKWSVVRGVCALKPPPDGADRVEGPLCGSVAGGNQRLGSGIWRGASIRRRN